MTATRANHRAPRPRPRGGSGGDRFRARRLAVERSAGLRRLRIVLGLTAVASLGIGLIAFLNSSAFDVDEIVVTGTDRSDPHLIAEASRIAIGQPLLDVDAGAAAGHIELVPWVGTAEVRRSWSGTVEIAVTERGPSVVLPAGDRFSLVDDHGRQLELVDDRPEGYLPVQGIVGSGVPGEPAPPEALPVIALLEALPPEVEELVSGVAVDGTRLYLELAAGGRVDFGDGSELGPKLQALETMLTRVDLTCLDTIDVRVPAAPVLTRRPSPAGDPEEVPVSGTTDC